MTESGKAKLLRRTGRAAKAHYRAAVRYGFLDNIATAASLFGGVLVIVASLYAELLRNQIVALGLAPLAVLTVAGFLIFVLTGAQAVWNWRAKSEQHRQVGALYAKARRAVDAAGDNEAALRKCRAQVDEIGEDSILVPPDIWKWAEREYAQKGPAGLK